MAQKIKLDLDSTDSLDFESTVDIPTPSGAPIKIPFTFVYRDRLQMAQLFDAFVAEAKAAEPAPDTTMVDAVDAAIGSDVAVIKRVATGWGLDDGILRAYRFIAENYHEGDRIYLFGFSRGAYTARALWID
jgi:hypothetical protein